MAAGLFPPIVETQQRSFDKNANDTFYITFTTSPFAKITDYLCGGLDSNGNFIVGQSYLCGIHVKIAEVTTGKNTIGNDFNTGASYVCLCSNPQNIEQNSDGTYTVGIRLISKIFKNRPSNGYAPAEDYIEGTKIYHSLGDVNNDGVVSVSDASILAEQNKYENNFSDSMKELIKERGKVRYEGGRLIPGATLEEGVTAITSYVNEYKRNGLDENENYKIQIRLTSANIPNFYGNETLAAEELPSYPFPKYPDSYFIGFADETNPEVADGGTWFNQNEQYFSEWSTVAIIRKSYPPHFSFSCADTNPVNISGSLNFDEPNELDFLKKYRIRVYTGNDQFLIVTSDNVFDKPNYKYKYLNDTFVTTELKDISDLTLFYFEEIINKEGYSPIIDSGWVTPETKNSFNYILDYYWAASPFTSFTVVVEYETYYGNKTYQTKEIQKADQVIDTTSELKLFNYQEVSNQLISSSPVSMNYVKQIETGKIKLVFTLGENISGQFQLSRVSAKNPEKVDRLIIFNELQSNIQYTYYDTTAEEGEWYSYFLQKITYQNGLPQYDNTIILGKTENNEEYVESAFGSAYLIDESHMLKIDLDKKVSSYKINTKDTKIETIGNKYPFIRRNAVVKYKTLPISGLISIISDEYNLFNLKPENKRENDTFYSPYNNNHVTDEMKQKYLELREKRNLTMITDTQSERKYRDEVIDFLSNGKPKLYKSPTEGNIIVQVTDLSFSPNDTLGGHIYSFSCTLVEFADFNASNQDKYKIINNNLE